MDLVRAYSIPVVLASYDTAYLFASATGFLSGGEPGCGGGKG
ncbi:MAG TPA: hypothetical protein VIG51_08250 [Candidatus Baltobacteraceae bacterium]|jgi:hypothetical protein